jgi:hypothetical protein
MKIRKRKRYSVSIYYCYILKIELGTQEGSQRGSERKEEEQNAQGGEKEENQG